MIVDLLPASIHLILLAGLGEASTWKILFEQVSNYK